MEIIELTCISKGEYIVRDPRYAQLAKNLVNYSLNIQPGEKLLIEVNGLEIPLAKELIKETYQAGGLPFVTVKNHQLLRQLIMHTSVEHMQQMASYELARMKEMDAYIGIRAGENVTELSDVPADKMAVYEKHFAKVVHTDERVPHTKWCVMRYPNYAMAQLAGMSTEAFEDFYFDVCNLDYSKMSAAMDKLVSLMEKTDKVHITGPGTDLTFAITGLPAIKCDGKVNIPDGEVFTAPVRESVEGYLTYNTPAVFQGYTYENIRLEFKAGKICNATANDTEKINRVFDTDQGARYVGEFAIGVNPYILKPMKDTLFDEKIMGSFHFTPGSSYDDCFNGNKSAIHWDLVCIQTPEYGGGEIYFDDVLIRKDGKFVIAELECLNPENLK